MMTCCSDMNIQNPRQINLCGALLNSKNYISINHPHSSVQKYTFQYVYNILQFFYMTAKSMLRTYYDKTLVLLL